MSYKIQKVQPIEKMTTSFFAPVPSSKKVLAEPMQVSSEFMKITTEPIQVTKEPMQETTEPMQETTEPMQETKEPMQETEPSNTIIANILVDIVVENLPMCTIKSNDICPVNFKSTDLCIGQSESDVNTNVCIFTGKN